MSLIPDLSFIDARQAGAVLVTEFQHADIVQRWCTSPGKWRQTLYPVYENENRFYSNRRQSFSIAVRLAALLIISCLGPGCQTPGPVRELTQTDRLMAAYPDLKGGKFALIADFESPTHMELVQLMGVSQNARSVRSTSAGRRETGGACLSFNTGSTHDTLILSNNFAARWYLRRDWRPFDLLLMAVQAPQDDLTLDLTIRAGANNNKLIVGMKERLTAGWNLLRIDLAELGERIPLDDIREIKLAISGSDNPVQINIDDIILTSSRDYLLGKTEDEIGSLYVQRKGRRWHIGAGGQFELVFANSQIVGWYNTETDPYKLKNLVQNTVLGPMPIILEEHGEPIKSQPEQRYSIRTHQRVLEMSPVRIILETSWQFTNEHGQNLPDNPRYVWTYTIYPTGQVFVDVLVAPPHPDQPSSQIGIAVSLASEKANTWIEPPASKDQTSSEPNTYAFARSTDANALLLFAPSVQGTAQSNTSSIQTRFDNTKKLRRWIYSTKSAPNDQLHFRCQIFVSSSMKHKDDEIRLRAQRRHDPGLAILEVGAMAPSSDQQDPFESGQLTGTINVTPDRSGVRMILDNTDRQFFTPCIRVQERTNRKAWVYVDHLIFKDFARESDGHLVFQLPDLAPRKIVVEVLFQQ